MADDRGFAADVERKAGAAGDKAGKSLGQRLRSALNPKNIGTALGAAFGTLAAAALKFGAEVDDAFDTIRVGTGATGEALEGLEADFKSVAGQVTNDIGDTAQVIADLNTRTGATGETLQGLAKTILNLSKITKTDAAANVAAATRLFGDWSVATENQTDTLDGLFRASQATGIGIDKLMTTVVQFGAPLRLMGFTLEESVALLGKWEKEGVNAEAILAALKVGVAKFAKEGKNGKQGLAEFVAEVERLGPGAEATSLAVKTFGSRAGPDMVAAVLEGRFAIEDYLAVVEGGSDTIDAATKDTEELGDEFAKFANQAKLALGGLAAGFGNVAQTLGPLLYAFPVLGGAIGRAAGAAVEGGAKIASGLLSGLARAAGSLKAAFLSNSVVSSISDGLTGALAKVQASPKVIAARTKLGNFLGSGLGKAVSIAFAAVMVLEVINTYNRVKGELEAQTAAISTTVRRQVTEGTTASLQASQAALNQGIRDLEGLWYNPFAGDRKAELQRDLAAVEAELERRTLGMPATVAGNIASGSGAVDTAADDLMDGLPDAVGDAVDEAGEQAARTPGEVADGIRSKRSEVQAAINQLKSDLENPMGTADEQAFLVGQLIDEELARGLLSLDPVVKAQAEATRDIIEERLAELGPMGENASKAAGDAIAKGLKSKDQTVVAQANRTAALVAAGFAPAIPAAEDVGEDIGDALGNSLGESVVEAVKRHVTGLNAYLRTGLRTSLGLPTPPRIVAPKPGPRALGGPVTAGQPYIVGERRAELFVPEVDGQIIPRVPAMEPSGSRPGDTYVTTINAPTLPLSPVDIAEQTARVKRLRRAS